MGAVNIEGVRGGIDNRPLLVYCGFDDAVDFSSWPDFCPVIVGSSGEVLGLFALNHVAILVLGPRLRPRDACDLLTRCTADSSQQPSINIVVHTSNKLEIFQDLVDDDKIFYLSRHSISAQQLSAIINAAADRIRGIPRGERSHFALLNASDDLLAFQLQIARQRDIGDACRVLVDMVAKQIRAASAQYLIHDPGTETLWSPSSESQDERRISSAAGLVGYVLHTAQLVRIESVKSDPRYDSDADDPDGDIRDAFIACPMRAENGMVFAVVSAVRSGGLAAFSRSDAQTLMFITEIAAPTFAILLLENHAQRLLAERVKGTIGHVFENKALEHCLGSPEQEAELLAQLPLWLRLSYLLLLLMIVLSVGYVCVVRVHEIAKGPVLIQAKSKTDIIATSSGVVRSIAVSVGQKVNESDLLVRLESGPGDGLLSHLKEESRAPNPGIVGGVLIRLGQEVHPGDPLVTIVNESAGNELIAFLPGSYAPQIRKGAEMTVKFSDYPDSNEIVQIDDVSSEIIGPQQANRYLGDESAGSFNISGPVIVARSTLPKEEFDAGGRAYAFHDGMIGDAEVSVRSEPFIMRLIPGLRELKENPHRIFQLN
jgi:membrane fusion protein (multidrug efflux system)